MLMTLHLKSRRRAAEVAEKNLDSLRPCGSALKVVNLLASQLARSVLFERDDLNLSCVGQHPNET